MRRRVPREVRWLRCLPAVILLAGACGCGNTATVTGKVTYQGRPVTYGSVIFLSADNTACEGVIEPDGSYTVQGVHAGDVKIGVISRDPSKGRSVLRGEKPARPGKAGGAPRKPPPEGWFPLPTRFEDPASSGLGCTIASGHVVHPIEIK
jgi:hypothetical protein